jgi:hypothetical protein
MDSKKTFRFSLLIFCFVLVILVPSCDCRCDSNVDPPKLQLEDSPTTNIDSVMTDIATVYPIVPDEGKEGGQVTLPPSSTSTTTSKTVSPTTSTSVSTTSSTTSTSTSTSTASTTSATSSTTSTTTSTTSTTTSTVVVPVTTKLTYAHVQPGVYSEVYLDVEGAPGQAVTAELTGPGVISSRAMDGKTDSSGKLHLTWKINMYGTYSVQGMVDAEAFIKQVNVY